MTTHYAEATDFPKLFEQTYWGGFELSKKQQEGNDDNFNNIIKNRNEFAKKYNLNTKSWCRDKIPYRYKLEIRCMAAEYCYRANCGIVCSSKYDHFECYRTKINDVDSLILIVSNYKTDIPHSIIEEQWEIVPKMYGGAASVTWQLIVPVDKIKKPLTLHEKYYLDNPQTEVKYMIFQHTDFEGESNMEIAYSWQDAKEIFDKLVTEGKEINKESHAQAEDWDGACYPLFIKYVDIWCFPYKWNNDPDDWPTSPTEKGLDLVERKDL